MLSFQAKIKRFNKKGEKTGWSFIEISKRQAEKLNPGNRQSFRVKGKLDDLSVAKIALMPMGDGSFIMPINATMRKGTRKKEGDTLRVELDVDKSEFRLSGDFRQCLEDEPRAYKFFLSLPKSHQRYFNTWIESARTMETKARRIAMAITGLSQQQGFGEMIRANKKLKAN